MNTMVTDEQLQDLFESFDNAIKWRDMDIYELNRRGYMGLVSTPNEGAGIPFLKQLVHRVRQFGSAAKKVVDTQTQGRAIAMFSDSLEKLRAEMQDAAVALQYLGYRHPDSMAGFPDVEITKTVEAGIDKVLHASDATSTTTFYKGVSDSAWMNEATRALAIGKVMKVPTFYTLNIWLGNCERDPNKYAPVMRDVEDAKRTVMAYLRTLFTAIPADAPPQHSEAKNVWKDAHETVMRVLNKSGPMMRRHCLRGAPPSRWSPMATIPMGPTAHLAFLVGAYVARYQEVLDAHALLQKHHDAGYAARLFQRERHLSLVQDPQGMGPENARPGAGMRP
ncbi:hypothetical protein [Acidithiobacillus ferriphilus]|uniref:hypothetical protein n=1 Tax=Acidithiobacillus ferriphilus TaxID=1689834 RepID=UPI002DBF1C19|nr:hypothetical protein [Acidithiobacillus ferriphilus]MEB8535561.1 hypothetical protein [Acidithiobacillus ferriphilus]